MVKPICALLLLPSLWAGCDDTISLPADLAAPPGVTLQQGTSLRDMVAWYSILITPFEMGRTSTDLVITIVDPAFACDSAPLAPDLDAISFQFYARLPGVTQGAVISHRGAVLGVAGEGFAELHAVDDRFLGWDGGAIAVGSGGAVGGRVEWQAGQAQLRGQFVARHCAVLDVAAAP